MRDAVEPNEDDALTQWVKEYRDATMMRFQGEFLGIDSIRDAGMKRYTRLVHGRDAAVGPGARDVLIPLLNDPDDGVRAISAAYLLNGRPDLAIPVLQDLEDNSMTEAHSVAYLALIMYRLGDFKM